jgi:CheY-like chemotaxis protein
VQTKAKVLIVDDDSIVRKSFSRIFAKYTGEITFEITEAENGADAVSKTKQLQPDLILMDINMPVMNGLKAAAEIKQMSPEYRLALVTSSTAPEDIKKAKEANADLYITKGASRKDVQDSLYTVIDVLIMGKSLPGGNTLIPFVREGIEALFKNRVW